MFPKLCSRRAIPAAWCARSTNSRSPGVLLEELPLQLGRARVAGALADARGTDRCAGPAVAHVLKRAHLDLAVSGTAVVQEAGAVAAVGAIRRNGHVRPLAAVLLGPQRGRRD